jgi:hypothetical protein
MGGSNLAPLEPDRPVAKGEGGATGPVKQGGRDEGVKAESHGFP